MPKNRYESAWKCGPQPNEKRAVMSRIGNMAWSDFCIAHYDCPRQLLPASKSHGLPQMHGLPKRICQPADQRAEPRAI